MRDNAITEIELLTGRPVPEDLRSYFRGDSGVIELPAETDVPDSSPWIDQVYQLYDADDALTLLRQDAESAEYGVRHVPPGTIPVGDNGNGDFYVVSTRKEDFGSVSYPFHETTDPLDETLTGAYRLASGFSDWIESFRPLSRNKEKPGY